LPQSCLTCSIVLHKFLIVMACVCSSCFFHSHEQQPHLLAVPLSLPSTVAQACNHPTAPRLPPTQPPDSLLPSCFAEFILQDSCLNLLLLRKSKRWHSILNHPGCFLLLLLQFPLLLHHVLQLHFKVWHATYQLQLFFHKIHLLSL
jgi:hypothetical protein